MPQPLRRRTRVQKARELVLMMSPRDVPEALSTPKQGWTIQSLPDRPLAHSDEER